MSRIHYIIFIFNLLIILLVENVKCRASRIHHGMPADNSFSFVVKILLEDYREINGAMQLDFQSICSGSLVTKQHVITAGHCVAKPDGTFYPGEYSVFSGAIDLDSPDGNWTKVKEIYVPSYFRDDDHYRKIGDIAVLKLEQPLSSNKISLLKLPKPYQDPPAGMRGSVAGYGLYDAYLQDIKESNEQGNLETKQVIKGEFPKTLQYAVSEILSQNECVDIHKPNGDVITEFHLCAQMIPINENNAFRGVCGGDSGGALVVGDVLVGVVSHSFSHTCNENDRPEIYTRVSRFVRFIINVINGNTNNLCVAAHIPKTTPQIEKVPKTTLRTEKEVIEETLSLMDQCIPIS